MVADWLHHDVDVEELGGDDLRAEYRLVLGRLEDDRDAAVTNPGLSGQLLAVGRGMRKQCGDVKFEAEISIGFFDEPHTVIIIGGVSQILI